jgi:hypothetical protein
MDLDRVLKDRGQTRGCRLVAIPALVGELLRGEALVGVAAVAARVAGSQASHNFTDGRDSQRPLGRLGHEDAATLEKLEVANLHQLIRAPKAANPFFRPGADSPYIWLV